MKILIIVFMIVGTLSCKPEQEATEFNTLVRVPRAADSDFETKEDTPILISYDSTSVDKSNSASLRIEITEHPKNGKLSNCKFSSDSTSFECQYSPNKDFSGNDSLSVRYLDGDMKSDNSGVLRISVIPVADAPIAIDGSQFGDYSKPLRFSLPQAKDSDTLSKDLVYHVEQVSNKGTLSDCDLTNGNRSCTLNIAEEYRGSIEIKYYVTDSDSLKSNVATFELLSSTKFGIKTFTQGIKELKKADIVWVIDNSRSMADEQETLKQNFSSFIDNFLDSKGTAKFPFKMSVITTDTYWYTTNNGSSFQKDSAGNPFDLTSQMAETNFAKFKNNFQKAVSVGIEGSGNELALASMEKSFQLDPAWYGGDDTLLVYIILSDEKEQSYAKTIDQWLSYFFSHKNQNFKVKFYPIINLAQDSGRRYGTLSSKTNTQLSDITKNFDSVLDAIGKDVDQAINSFHIGGNNILIMDNSIKVSINGTNMPTGWKYTNGNIVMDVPPAAGTQIKVTFEYK